MMKRLKQLHFGITENSKETNYISNNKNTGNKKIKTKNSNKKNNQGKETSQRLPKKAKQKKTIAVVGDSMVYLLSQFCQD